MKPKAWFTGVAILGVLAIGAFSGCGDGNGGVANDACEGFCATLEMCGLGLVSGPCLDVCQTGGMEAAATSGACLNASEAEGRCVAALSCDGVDRWREDGPDAPCQAEDAAADAACNP
jgi:hypothetical protein